MNIMNEFVRDYLEQTPFVSVSSQRLSWISNVMTNPTTPQNHHLVCCKVHENLTESIEKPFVAIFGG